MGHRNPWRISIDNETGYIYWGEVGPDASKDSIIGPRGYDDLTRQKSQGFSVGHISSATTRPIACSTMQRIV